MIAVLLAAGMARRLRPLTDERPKCLLTVGSRTLLGRTVDALLERNIREIVVVTGYRGEMIREFLLSHYLDATFHFHFIDNPDYDSTNNIYSLWLARPVADGRDFLLLDSDILFDPRLIDRVLEGEGSVLSVNRHELGEEEMKVVVEEGRIVEISKTCPPEKALGESVGIEKISASDSTALFQELQVMMEQEHLVDIFYERAFERLIPQGHTFRVAVTTDVFSIELDTVEDFNQARQLIPHELF